MYSISHIFFTVIFTRRQDPRPIRGRGLQSKRHSLGGYVGKITVFGRRLGSERHTPTGDA